jgi:hypothetical protein
LENENVSAGSYLTKIIIDEPNNYLITVTLATRTYYNSQEEIDLIEKLFFDAYRGEKFHNIALAEPVLEMLILLALI